MVRDRTVNKSHKSNRELSDSFQYFLIITKVGHDWSNLAAAAARLDYGW